MSTSSFHPDTSSSFHPGTSCHSLLLNPRVQTPPRMMRGRFRTEGEEAKDTTVVIVSHPCLCRASQTGPQTQPQIPRPMRRQRDRQRDRQTHTHTHTHTQTHRQADTDRHRHTLVYDFGIWRAFFPFAATTIAGFCFRLIRNLQRLQVKQWRSGGVCCVAHSPTRTHPPARTHSHACVHALSFSSPLSDSFARGQLLIAVELPKVEAVTSHHLHGVCKRLWR